MSRTLSHLRGPRRVVWWADRERGDLPVARELVMYDLRYPRGESRLTPTRYRVTAFMRAWPDSKTSRIAAEFRIREGGERNRVRMALRAALVSVDRDDVDVPPTRHRNSVRWDWY